MVEKLLFFSVTEILKGQLSSENILALNVSLF